jgi:HNH endonuclease
MAASSLRTCKRCGTPWTLSGDDRRTKWCSPRCGVLAAHDRRRKPAVADRCAFCAGVLDLSTHMRSFMRYCSKACKSKGWLAAHPDRKERYCETQRAKRALKRPAPVLHANTCKQCGKQWAGEHRSTICSRPCQLAWSSAQSLAKALALHRSVARVTACEDCRVEFCPLYGASHTRLCSSCSDERARIALRKYRKKRGGNASRRAKMRGLERKYFNESRIFERDKWRCQLCGVKTPKRLRGTYDDCAPDLDHVVTYSDKGSHTKENVQCACRKCNGEKGGRSRGQIWLPGFA